jgi:hypothetical protein
MTIADRLNLIQLSLVESLVAESRPLDPLRPLKPGPFDPRKADVSKAYLDAAVKALQPKVKTVGEAPAWLASGVLPGSSRPR